MKRSKIEFDSVWKAAIHDLLVREHYTNTKLESQIEDLNDEVINLMRCDAAKDNRIEDLERRIKKQEEIIGRLLTDMSSLATDYMDLSIKLGDMDTTVASLVADKDALISHNKCLSKKENELQAQVDELQAQVDDQFEAIGRLSTGMENVAKALTDLDGWLDSVEVVLSALRKST